MRFPMKSGEYENLKELVTDWEVIYGPFKSRRLGASLGINLLGTGQKICSFDCLYCELGRTEVRMYEVKKKIAFLPVAGMLKKIEDGLRQKIKSGVDFTTINFVGNGEPTLYPEFDVLVEGVCRIRNDLAPGKKLGVFTNGTTLEEKKTVQALNLLDERYVKFDAGNEKMLKAMNSSLVRTSVNRILSGARNLKDVVAQSMFVRGAVDNTSNQDIDDWMESLGLLKPKMVHLYSLDRVPAAPGLVKVDTDWLDTLAARLERRTGLSSLVF